MRASAFMLVFLAALLAGATPRAQIRLPSIKNSLIELALDQISSPGSFEITAGSIEDAEDGATSLLDVQVSDGEGAWMTLERLNFSWAPDKLISGELAITQLEVIGLTVSRPPSADAEAPELKPQEPWSKGLFDWPRAPLSLSIEGVRLERTDIAEGVLPQAIQFDAEGRAFDQGDIQEFSLVLRRTDAVTGDISLAMRRDFAANTIKLDLNANEAPGGLIAAAAGFPDDAPARLNLSADGPPEDWRVVFSATVDRVFNADGHATLAYSERLQVDADLTVAPGPEIGAKARAILGDAARFRARIAEQPDGMIEIIEGRLTAPALSVDATGSFATGTGESDLAVSLEALSPLSALAEGVAFDRFTFDGAVTGPQGGLIAEGALGLDGLRTAPADAMRLVLDARVVQTPDGALFYLDGRGDGLRLDRIGPDAIGPATLSAAGALAGDRLSLDSAALQSKALTARADGDYDMAARTGDLTVTLQVPEVTALSAAYDVVAKGAITADARVNLAGDEITAGFSADLQRFAMEQVAAEWLAIGGRVRQTPARLTFDVTGEGAGLALDQIPTELTDILSFAAQGMLESDRLSLESLNLNLPLIDVEAAGGMDLAGGTLGLDYAVSTIELAPVAQAYGADFAGELAATGRIEGSLETPRFSGRAAIAEGVFDGQSYGLVELTHDVVVGPALEGALKIAMRGGWLGDGDAATRFLLEGTALTLEDLEAELLGATVAGDVRIDLDAVLIDGALALSTPDLAPLARFAGVDLSGAAKGQVTLAADAGRQNLAATLGLAAVATAGVSARGANLTLNANDAMGAPILDLKFDAEGVQAGGAVLQTLHATAKGGLDDIAFTASANGALGAHPLSAALAGGADLSGDITAITLSRAEAALGAEKASLRKPLDLRIGAGGVEVTGLDLALPEGASMTGAATQTPEGLTGKIAVARLPMTMLQRLAEAPVSAGRLDMQASFDTRPSRANAKITARGRDIIFEGAEAARGLALDVDAGWTGARLNATAEIKGDFGDPMRARFALPLRIDASGLPYLPDEAIDGAIAWRGRLGDLWALVPAPGHLLDGAADIDLRISGRLDNPLVSGKADLTGGSYQNLVVGTILSDLTVRTEIAGSSKFDLTLDASDGAEGRLTANTSVQLGRNASVNMAARIEQATLVRRDDVTAQISGDLALTGPFDALTLKGRLSVDMAEVRLVNATPPSVVELDGVRIKGEPDEDGDGDGDGEDILALDIVVETDRDFFVRGRGLDSEWKMNLVVKGDAAAPVVTGAIEKVRGRLDFLGKPFTLTRGAITFDGARKIDPLIDVGLERESPDFRGGIYVEGRASDPMLRFSSVPNLPEDEVLPRLLFGQSKQSLTGAQAIQLATGLATLLGGGPGPLDNLRDAAGLDVLRLSGTGADDATVTVGRNIGENIFVGARQKLGGEGSSIAVEVEVFDGLLVDSEIGADQGANVGLTWRKDF